MLVLQPHFSILHLSLMKILSLLAVVLFLVGCTTEVPTSEEVTEPDTEILSGDDLAKGYSQLTGLPEFKAISTETVTYYTKQDGTEIKGYLAMPEGEGPFPAIVMIHEWWGLNDNIRKMAEQYAGQGYAALAVDLYEGQAGTTREEAGALAGAVRERKDEAFNNLNAALDYLKLNQSIDNERLASLGWCFGGGWSYEMAKNNLGTKASVIYYGRFNPEDDLSIMSTNIQGHFGAEDRSIPVDDVKAFQAKLATLKGEHQVFIYENAGHAFANEENDAYQQESAEQAWDRTLEFLKTNL